LDIATDIVKYTEQNGVTVITYNDVRYPKRLKRIDNCPIVLYCKGDLGCLDELPSVGVVGTRRYSAQGERITKRISYDLSRSGFTIVSGLARGIDSFAHKAALYNKSKTVAVLGCGIDVIYPPENRELTLRMYENALVITEFAPGTRPLAWNFPARNRIISALSDVVFVAECTLKSGTIITADHAFEHNIPVCMHDALCGDALGYLKGKGAVSVTNSDDITCRLRERYPQLKPISELPKLEKLLPDEVVVTVSPLNPFKPSPKKKSDVIIKENIISDPVPERKTEIIQPTTDVLDEQEKAVLKLLEIKPMDIDQMAESGFDVSQLLRTLTILEIKGMVISVAGGKYVKNLAERI